MNKKKGELFHPLMLLHSIQHGSTKALFAGIDLIEKARHSVILSTYYIEANGKSGKCLFEALKRCKAPSIRVLTNHHYLDTSPIYSYLRLFGCLNHIEIRSWNHLFMNSNHAKFIIVDNYYVSLGGFNFQEALFMEPSPWKDLGLILYSNDIANQLTIYFDSMWKQASPIHCKSSVQNISICPKERRGRSLDLDVAITTYTVLSQYPQGWFLHANKSNAFHSILHLLDHAKKTISILCPNVIDSCIWNILTKKLNEGVKVKIVTNRNQNNIQTFFSIGEKEVDLFQRKQHPRLQIRFSNLGFGHNLLPTDHRNWLHDVDHSKFFDIDQDSFYIGSFNLDPMSLHAIGEIGLLIWNEPMVTSHIHTFLFEYCWKHAHKWQPT